VVKGKHGEPTDWDGLASVFVLFARRSSRDLTVAERGWLSALESYMLGEQRTRHRPLTKQ
jgi:hypothetical protein